MNNELPYQTWQRVTGKTWTGGNSADVMNAYKQYGITDAPGSAAANLALQKALIAGNNTNTNTNTDVNQPVSTPTDPIVDSSGPRAEDAATTADVTDLIKTRDSSSKLLQDRMDMLEAQRASTIEGLKKSYEEALKQQAERQGREYAGTSTNLVTAGGGFLGYTGSQSGVLNTMQHTFDQEKSALMAKRDAAIQEAQNAINDKQFDLAREKANVAREAEKEIYNRQQDFANNKLKLAQEARAQQEFDMGITDKKISAYASMDDAEFAKLTPAQLAETDKFYYPGYTAAARNIEKQAMQVQSQKDQVALDVSILNVLKSLPAGQVVTIGGKQYAGMKPASTGSAKGLISPLVIEQFPELKGLANQKAEDVILTLASSKPAPWYKTYLEQQNGQSVTPEILQSAWDTFRDDPALTPFRNSARINDAMALPSGNSDDDSDIRDAFGA